MSTDPVFEFHLSFNFEPIVFVVRFECSIRCLRIFAKVLSKQLQTKGASPEDIVNGTTDGGGENEGHAGVHRFIELLNPSYVRRRCMLHLSWRVADAGIRVIVEQGRNHVDISTYLRDGVTWTRLVAITTQPASRGGLSLLVSGSQEHAEFSSVKPPKVIDDRPETDFEFLAWLIPRQRLLGKLAELEMQAMRKHVR